MDPITSLLTATPVIATIMVAQMIKMADKKNKLKRWYFVISVVVGAGFGILFTKNEFTNVQGLIQDGVMNALYASFAYQFKKVLGWKLPGDTAK